MLLAAITNTQAFNSVPIGKLGSGMLIGRESSLNPRKRAMLWALPCPEGVDPKMWKTLSKQKRQEMIALIEADDVENDSSDGSNGSPAAGRFLGDTTDALPTWSNPDGTINPALVPSDFRAGFVSIVGYPNAGKSTLMNKLLGENLSIATAKAQTTRHRIMGVATGLKFQLVYSDTPGVVVQPRYRLHQAMMKSVKSAVSDADVLLAVVDASEAPPASLAVYMPTVDIAPEDEADNPQTVEIDPSTGLAIPSIARAGPREEASDDFFLKVLSTTNQPIVLALNKVDVLSEEQAAAISARWQQLVPRARVVPVSALMGTNSEALLAEVTKALPLSLPLYHADTLTDKPEKFFASEIIRECIFNLYAKEVPFSCEVIVTSFKDIDPVLKITATIMVSRDSQKGILIGAKGTAIKRLSTQARESLETFFGKKIFLETNVAVSKDWRSSANSLKKYGYEE